MCVCVFNGCTISLKTQFRKSKKAENAIAIRKFNEANSNDTNENNESNEQQQ